MAPPRNDKRARLIAAARGLYDPAKPPSHADIARNAQTPPLQFANNNYVSTHTPYLNDQTNPSDPYSVPAKQNKP